MKGDKWKEWRHLTPEEKVAWVTTRNFRADLWWRLRWLELVVTPFRMVVGALAGAAAGARDGWDAIRRPRPQPLGLPPETLRQLPASRPAGERKGGQQG